MANEKIDLIIYQAKVYTVDKQFSIGEAVAIDDGKLIAIGRNDDIQGKFEARERIDAAGKFLYPGFIDAHCHFLWYGLNKLKVNLKGTESFEEAVQCLLNSKSKYRQGWLQAHGWDQNNWPYKQFPGREALDQAFPETPVFLERIDTHAAIVNKKALELAGITVGTQVEGGAIEIKNGKPSGLLIDKAIDLVRNRIPETTLSDKVNALTIAEKDCFANGITAVGDAYLSIDDMLLIDKLQDKGQLRIDMYCMLIPNERSFNYIRQHGILKKEKLLAPAFKFFADGAMGSRGAALLEPYSDDPDNIGLSLLDENNFHEAAQLAREKGMQVNTHCIGDRAARDTLQLYAQYLSEGNDFRWRIEHAQLVHPNDQPLFQQYNIIPSIQPVHALSDYPWIEERLGKRRLQYSYANKMLLVEAGLVAYGSDFPIESIDPLSGFYAAVARQNKQGLPENGFLPENALSRKEALQSMTFWAACANRIERSQGSIEVGKKANLFLSDTDLLEASLQDCIEANILLTISNGEIVYGKK